MTITCTNIQIGINVMLLGLVIYNAYHAWQLSKKYRELAGKYRELGGEYVELMKHRMKLEESIVEVERLAKGTN